MNFDFQMRRDVIKGFIEGRIYNGDDAHTVGADVHVLMEAMECSTIDSNSDDPELIDQSSGDYDRFR